MANKDWEAEAALLRVQYKALRPEEMSIREEEKREAKRRAEIRIQALRQALASEVARHLDAGMPKYVFQDQVIGTRDWSAMKKWAELMNLKSAEDVKSEKAKAAQEARGYIWADDYSTLTVTKSPKGNKIENPPVYLIGAGVYRSGRYLTSKLVDDAAERTPAREDPTAYLQGVSDEIARQMDAGNVPDIRNK